LAKTVRIKFAERWLKARIARELRLNRRAAMRICDSNDRSRELFGHPLAHAEWSIEKYLLFTSREMLTRTLRKSGNRWIPKELTARAERFDHSRIEELLRQRPAQIL